MTEPPYRARLREATRVDWRFLLGLAPDDVVLAAGTGGPRLARSLAPWVGLVRRFEQPPAAVGSVDWVFFSGAMTAAADDDQAALQQVRGALDSLRPGGHVALTLENRWGLHWLADWRVSDDTNPGTATRGRNTSRHGLRWHRNLLRAAGAADIRSYALLPSRDAPRAMIPVDPPCPAAAQRMVLDQVWQRATPAAAVVRRLLGVLVQAGLMRRLYPHYLVVGRKPC